MSLQEAHQFIRALTEQFQLDNQAAATDNDLQTMELLQQTVQKTRELRRQQLDGCQQLLRGTAMPVSNPKLQWANFPPRAVQEARTGESQVSASIGTAKPRRLPGGSTTIGTTALPGRQGVWTNPVTKDAIGTRIETIGAGIDAAQSGLYAAGTGWNWVRRSKYRWASFHVIALFRLRLKIYKSLGFDWQMDPQTQQFTKCRVRSADRSDVQTVSIDEQGAYSRFYLANKLWELCSQ